MQKHIMDIVVKISLLPFSEEWFMKPNDFSSLFKQVDRTIACTNSEQQRRNEELLYKEKFKSFKKEVYKMIRNKHLLESFDKINLLVEKYFPFSSFASYDSVYEFYWHRLSELTKCFIAHRDGKMVLKYWDNEVSERMYGAFNHFAKIELWNVFCRYFCVDLLVAFYLIDNGMNQVENLDGYYWLISVSDKQLDYFLEKGLSETHIHINAGTHFHILWKHLLEIDQFENAAEEILEEILDEKDEAQYKDYIQCASVLRLLLVAFLKEGKGFETLTEYISQVYCHMPRIYNNLHQIIEVFLHKNKQKINEVYIQNCYERLIRKIDNIKAYLAYEEINTTDENIYLFEAIKYMRSLRDNDRQDELFEEIFWQYIILKNIFYQCVTQNNYMQGLEHFQNYFERCTQKLTSEEEYFKECLKNQIYNNPLKKLEVRMSIQTDGDIQANLYKKLNMFFNTYKQLIEEHEKLEKQGTITSPMPQIGIIFHLIKKEDRPLISKCWYREQSEKYFYEDLKTNYAKQVEAINEARVSIPYLSRYIVGIDAASLEHSTEPWVFAPVYRAARDSKVVKSLIRRNHLSHIQDLGFTFHVGEEFRHILSGLRHIDEVVSHFGYHAGDRIGHGIALGIKVKEWCNTNIYVDMPRIEWLENLLWIWGLSELDEVDKDVINLNQIEREIMQLAEEIYENIQGITVFKLWKAYQGRFQNFTPSLQYTQNIEGISSLCQSNGILCDKGIPNNLQAWDIEALGHTYHCGKYLESMYTTYCVKVTDKQVGLIEYIQSYVKDKVNEKGVVVETNPTSNLAISGIENLFEHYINGLNNYGLNQEYENGLIVTINSDDPSVFNTSINNEFGYIYFMLQHKGYSKDCALHWINKVRQWGIDTSFIKSRTLAMEQIKKEIEAIIKEIE